MTHYDLRNSVSAFSDYMESQNVDFIALAYLDGKLHYAKTEAIVPDAEFVRAIGLAMRKDAELKKLILSAVGRYILPDQITNGHYEEE